MRPIRLPDTQTRLYALGRLKPGQMNRTEAAYDAFLAEQQMVGMIRWRMFEGIKLRLAPNTSLTVDFAVMRADGLLTMVDVKGAKHLFTDDARAKMKIAADKFPFVFKVVYPRAKKLGGGWIEEEV